MLGDHVIQEQDHSLVGNGVVGATLSNYGTIAAEIGDISLQGAITTYTDLAARNLHYLYVMSDVDGPGGWIAESGGTIYVSAGGPAAQRINTTGPINLRSNAVPPSKLRVGFVGCDIEMDAASLSAESSTALLVFDGAALIISGSFDHAITSVAANGFDYPGELRMTGGVGGSCDAVNWTTLEAAGYDEPNPARFSINRLSIGPAAAVALVDQHHNNARSAPGNELQHIGTLVIQTGGTLNLNGHTLIAGGVLVTPGPYGGGQIIDLALCNGAPCEPCDVECNGTVNPFDIQPFLDRLGPTPPAPCSPCGGDADGNGTVNPFDINAFLACLS